MTPGLFCLIYALGTHTLICDRNISGLTFSDSSKLDGLIPIVAAMQNLPFARLEWFVKWCSLQEVWIICQLLPCGEITGEEELSTLHIYLKNNCLVLNPETQNYIWLSVQIVISDFEYGVLTQKDLYIYQWFHNLTLSNVNKKQVVNMQQVMWYFDCKKHKIVLEKSIGSGNIFSDTKDFY